MLLRSLAWMLAAALLLPLLACGESGGGPVRTGPGVEEVRNTVRKLIVAHMKGDFDSVRNHLEVGEYLRQTGNATAFELDKLPPAEQEAHAKSCFNQLLSVKKQSVIHDEATLDSHLSRAEIEIYEQTRRAEISFKAMHTDGKMQLTYKGKLSQGADGRWKLLTFEVEV